MTGDTLRPLRVLVVATQEPWPLDHGGRLRWFHFIKQLTRVAEVTLALPGAVRHAARLPHGVRIVTMSPLASAAGSGNSDSRQVGLVKRLARRHFGYNDAIDAWLRRHARPERFDVALFSGPVLGQHVCAARVPVVWDCVDDLVLYTLRDGQAGGWRRWPEMLRHTALYALYERDVARQAAATLFASTADAACARRWTRVARVEVISNGVDFDYFRPVRQAPEPGTVAFVGSLVFPPNADGIVRFARRIWPQIHAGGGGRRLLVVGRRPVAAVRALASLPGVELAADVPDVRPYMARAAAIVVPTRLGGGVKNKILEACAMKRPVVASPRALAGLSARIGVEVLCADRPAAWVRQVSQLLRRRIHAERIAQAGYEWVRRTHRWTALGARLQDVLDAARRGSPRRAREAAAPPIAPEPTLLEPPGRARSGGRDREAENPQVARCGAPASDAAVIGPGWHAPGPAVLVGERT